MLEIQKEDGLALVYPRSTPLAGATAARGAHDPRPVGYPLHDLLGQPGADQEGIVQGEVQLEARPHLAGNWHHPCLAAFPEEAALPFDPETTLLPLNLLRVQAAEL